MDYQKLIIDNLDRIINLWLLVDDQNSIVHCSQLACWHLGFDEGELINQPFGTLLTDDEENRDQFLDQLLLNSYLGVIVNQKARFKLKNKVIIDVELSMHRLTRDDKEFKLVTFDNTTDIVELTKLVNAKTEALQKKYYLFDKDGIADAIRDIIEGVLVSVTAGQGLRFNRAFLFFVNEENTELRGIKAIGPGSGEEAGIIYGEFHQAPKTLTEAIKHYHTLVNPDSTVNEIARNIRIDMADTANILIQVLNSQKYLLINDDCHLVDNPSVKWLRDTFQINDCLVVPLVWHGRSTGLIIADNQVTRLKITNADIKALTRFAGTAANVIESAKLLSSLEKSIVQIKQANITIKASQTMLLQKEKLAAMGELVAHMAHEVRGPLTTIGGFASRVFKQLDRESEHYNAIFRIVETVKTLELVINDILDGSLPVKQATEGCDCTKAVNKVLALLEEEIHRRKVSVNLNIQGNLPKISIKEHHLFEIVNNIVKNALDAIGEDGLLLILINSVDNKVVITVQDTGHGISHEVEKKIFSPFFTTKKRGTGLGLVVVKKLVDEYHGVIELRSIPEKGTTFIISFPIEEYGDNNA